MRKETKKEPLIIISEHHFFQQTNAAVEMAMELSRARGFNLPRKKPKSLSLAEESRILNHPLHQLTSPRGIQLRMLWFCVSQFIIRDNTECYELRYQDFEQGVNEAGASFVW